MYISTKRLVDSMLDTGLKLETVEMFLEVISSLLARHGFLLKTPLFQEKVAAVDEDIAASIRFLEQYNMLKSRSLKHLLQTVRSHPAYTSHPTHVKTSRPETVYSVFEAEEAAQLDIEQTLELGMKVERDGKIYKRDLDSDITTLLSK